MPEKELPIYKKAVITHRSAERIAKVHGAETVTELATSLMPNARVVDLGAGASPFGRIVAELRPDVVWTNFDYSYHDVKILAEVSADAPPNLSHVAGDVTQLSPHIPSESVDYVFSYWLWPHLSLHEPAPALVAARGAYQILKNGGRASIGPFVGSSDIPFVLRDDAIPFTKRSDTSEEEFAQIIATQTQLPRMLRLLQAANNEVLASYVGTSRSVKEIDGKRYRYDPRTGEYIRAYSPRALRVYGKMCWLTGKYMAKELLKESSHTKG